MYSQIIANDPFADFLDFSMREITGRWVSRESATAVRIYRKTSRKRATIRLELTYNNPLVVCDCKVYSEFGQHYIELYERVNIVYDQQNEILHLSAFGEYIRAEE